MTLYKREGRRFVPIPQTAVRHRVLHVARWRETQILVHTFRVSFANGAIREGITHVEAFGPDTGNQPLRVA